MTGPPYKEMDENFYVDRNGSLRTITWKNEDDDDDDDIFEGTIENIWEPELLFIKTLE